MVTNSNVVPDICEKLNLSKRDFLKYATGKNIKAIQTGEMNAREFWENFTENSGIEVDSDYFYDFFKPKRRQKMYEMIERIKSKGFRVVLGTNTIDSHFHKHTDNGDYAIFEKVYPSNLMGYSKPDPEFLKHILKEEEVAAENAIFIDDSVDNIESAKTLGINTIHFDEPENVLKRLEETIK